MQRNASRPIWIAVLAAGAFMAVTAVLLLRSTSDSIQPTILNESSKLAACRAEALSLVKPEKVDVGFLTQISNFCYTQVRGEDLLGDFNIRRTNYLRQQFQGIVFLWMVVAITISGVVLAALQLIGAYKLASTGRGDLNQGGEITLEEKRISLKSSVTGLLILTVSFAFFIVFVVWVYPLTESKGPEGFSQTASPQPMLGVGGLGSVPRPSANTLSAPAGPSAAPPSTDK
jgi:hypothetical protein